MRRISLLLLLCLLAVNVIRCTSFESDPPANSDASTPDALAPDAADASPLAEEAAADASRCDSSCPGTAGPCGVPVATWCIDSTEVTVADFKVFEEAVRNVTIDAGQYCSAITVAPVALGDGALPVTNVTFCEARAYCAWAGKRLCGHVSGGTLTPDQSVTPISQWFAACSGGAADFRLLSDGGCQLEAGSPRPANGTCEGSLSGVFDMVGNVWEWVDAVESSVPAMTFLGAGSTQANSSTCRSQSGSGPDFRAFDVGFRCCSN